MALTRTVHSGAWRSAILQQELADYMTLRRQKMVTYMHTILKRKGKTLCWAILYLCECLICREQSPRRNIQFNRWICSLRRSRWIYNLARTLRDGSQSLFILVFPFSLDFACQASQFMLQICTLIHCKMFCHTTNQQTLLFPCNLIFCRQLHYFLFLRVHSS